MKRLICYIALLIITVSGCAGTGNLLLNAPVQHFMISIEQDGAAVDIVNNRAYLEKKPFAIVVTMANPDSVFVSASISPKSFESACSGMRVDEISGFSEEGITEELFNREQVLVLSDHSPNFWQYTNENEHRFSEVSSEQGAIRCKRVISYIQDLDSKREKMQLSDFKGRHLYLVFMKLEWNKDYSKKIEKKRVCLELVFSDNDLNVLFNKGTPKNY